jgi:lipopolysaccharide export system protein LptA
MLELDLDQFDEFYIRDEMENLQINNRVYFEITFPSQLKLSIFVDQIRLHHGDMKIKANDTIIRFNVRFKDQGNLNYHLYQSKQNILKLKGNGFILKNAKW